MSIIATTREFVTAQLLSGPVSGLLDLLRDFGASVGDRLRENAVDGVRDYLQVYVYNKKTTIGVASLACPDLNLYISLLLSLPPPPPPPPLSLSLSLSPSPFLSLPPSLPLLISSHPLLLPFSTTCMCVV